MRSNEVILLKDKIYTSYFARASKIIPDRRLISIALSSPENWGGSYLRELNPSPYLIHNIKNGIITPEEYEQTYRLEVLNNLDPTYIMDKTLGKVMCCWEKSGDFCHRHIVLNWLRENLGNNIIGGEV